MGNMGGRGGMGVNDKNFIKITGGMIDIYSTGDGIDSNGHIYVEGGIISVSGHSMIAEGTIDADGDIVITGGDIITAGSWENVSSKSTQPLIVLSYSKEQALGSVITIVDSEGYIILEYTSRIAYSRSGFTSDLFKIGETYTLYIDGEPRVDITLNSTITTISDTGGAYDGNGMGGRGGMPNRRR
jgi:hypothetical protein